MINLSFIKENKVQLVLVTVLVIANGVIGHFFSPWGLNLTPFLIAVTSFLICFFSSNIPILWKSVLIYFFIGLNDWLIKLYSGGHHDGVGQAWILFFELIGLFFAFLFLTISVFGKQKEPMKIRVLAIVLFLVLIGFHYYLFANLGVGRYY